MANLMELLNANAGALSVMFAGVVTFATVVYAVLTWKLVSETRLMREVHTEPKIEVLLKSLDIALHIVRLHIKNVGLGPALEVRFTFREVKGGAAASKLIEDFSETNFFKVGLAYFGPGQERYSHYTQMTEDHDGKIASVIAVDLSYNSATGRAYREQFLIDMSEYKGSYQLGRPHMYSIAQSLEKLQKSVDHIATGFRRPRIDIYTANDRKAERAEIEERRRERAEQSKPKAGAGQDDT